MAAAKAFVIAPTTGGLGGAHRGTLYIHVATGLMAIKTDNVVGGAWAVTFTSIHSGMVTAWNSVDALTEPQADALVAEWMGKIP